MSRRTRRPQTPADRWAAYLSAASTYAEYSRRLEEVPAAHRDHAVRAAQLAAVRAAGCPDLAEETAP